MSSENRPTLLVVDDVPENITVLSAMLRDQYRVLFATSGEEALEVVAEERIDLILLDVLMPEMDGYEVCRRLKTDGATRHIPIVLVTALSDAAEQARGRELGAADTLPKPCAPDIVRQCVARHLNDDTSTTTPE